ncbi:IQ calmodulin-binding motif domain-containing protein [Planoprotostelium fungivorum]|uniref:IQ calmodulin-binding motif domain-containing protein n=1 Tax=Planoprotostelium fungivorum TaxID=1890364 RepID=A0A2P6MSA6_9EUKA|nr:IQ calmodulin-binding motif domain-containing protein [Planoprotostelium fungivorum]
MLYHRQLTTVDRVRKPILEGTLRELNKFYGVLELLGSDELVDCLPTAVGQTFLLAYLQQTKSRGKLVARLEFFPCVITGKKKRSNKWTFKWMEETLEGIWMVCDEEEKFPLVPESVVGPVVMEHVGSGADAMWKFEDCPVNTRLEELKKSFKLTTGDGQDQSFHNPNPLEKFEKNTKDKTSSQKSGRRMSLVSSDVLSDSESNGQLDSVVSVNGITYDQDDIEWMKKNNSTLDAIEGDDTSGGAEDLPEEEDMKQKRKENEEKENEEKKREENEKTKREENEEKKREENEKKKREENEEKKREEDEKKKKREEDEKKKKREENEEKEREENKEKKREENGKKKNDKRKREEDEEEDEEENEEKREEKRKERNKEEDKVQKEKRLNEQKKGKGKEEEKNKTEKKGKDEKKGEEKRNGKEEESDAEEKKKRKDGKKGKKEQKRNGKEEESDAEKSIEKEKREVQKKKKENESESEEESDKEAKGKERNQGRKAITKTNKNSKQSSTQKMHYESETDELPSSEEINDDVAEDPKDGDKKDKVEGEGQKRTTRKEKATHSAKESPPKRQFLSRAAKKTTKVNRDISPNSSTVQDTDGGWERRPEVVNLKLRGDEIARLSAMTDEDRDDHLKKLLRPNKEGSGKAEAESDSDTGSSRVRARVKKSEWQGPPPKVIQVVKAEKKYIPLDQDRALKEACKVHILSTNRVPLNVFNMILGKFVSTVAQEAKDLPSASLKLYINAVIGCLSTQEADDFEHTDMKWWTANIDKAFQSFATIKPFSPAIPHNVEREEQHKGTPTGWLVHYFGTSGQSKKHINNLISRGLIWAQHWDAEGNPIEKPSDVLKKTCVSYNLSVPPDPTFLNMMVDFVRGAHKRPASNDKEEEKPAPKRSRKAQSTADDKVEEKAAPKRRKNAQEVNKKSEPSKKAIGAKPAVKTTGSAKLVSTQKRTAKTKKFECSLMYEYEENDFVALVLKANSE